MTLDREESYKMTPSAANEKFTRAIEHCKMVGPRRVLAVFIVLFLRVEAQFGQFGHPGLNYGGGPHLGFHPPNPFGPGLNYDGGPQLGFHPHDPFGGLYHEEPVVVHHHHYHEGSPRRQRQQQQPQANPIFSAKSPVYRLSANKFPNEKSNYLWLVMFHDRKDPSAKAASAVERLALKVHPKLNFKVGSVDCQAFHEFCRKRVGPITDLPRFAFVVDGKMESFLDWDDDDDGGSVSAQELYNFALQNMPKHLIRKIRSVGGLEDKLLDSIDKGSKEGAVVVLTDKNETSGLLYGLAYKYRHQIVFGEAQGSKTKLINRFSPMGIISSNDKLPIVHAWTRKEKETGSCMSHTYTGLMKGEAITQWLEVTLRKTREGRATRAESDIGHGETPSPVSTLR